MKRRPDEHIRLLVAALMVGMAPHILVLPAWIDFWCLGAWSFILFLDLKKKTLPPRWIQWLLTLIAFSAILASSRGRFDSDSGIGLLCLMASLKPLEITGVRDRMITVFLAYFMVASGLFFSNSLEMSLYLFVAVIVITGLLIRINYPDMWISSSLRLSFVMTAQALPLALILFVVFPRIQGGLWGIQQRKTGLSGLSSTLSPGSLTQMAKNEAVAFRASFGGDIPLPSQRYWRAMVFDSFDGKRWYAGRGNSPAVHGVSGGAAVDYEVILEPHNERWLFVLDYPSEVAGPYELLSDYTVRSRQRIISKTRYTARSHMVPMTGGADTWEWVSRSLPPQSNPRSRDFARTLRGETASDQAFVDRVLAYFHDQEYYYSLDPPTLERDPVDDFLFRTREGYCEHYASAFVVLMRAAGLPARVVGGYLGGEVNPYGNYLIVRQSLAHAWSEVWLETKGWVRVDPTGAIARERVKAGAAGAGNQGAGDDSAGKEAQGVFASFVDNLQMGWDSLNYLWYAKVISYTAQSQKQLFERLGWSLDTVWGWLKTLGLALVLAAGLIALYALNLLIKHRKHKDPVVETYRVFLNRLEKVGLPRFPHEGPRDFASRASELRKDLGVDIAEISRHYILLRYGGKDTETDRFKYFRNRVRSFRPDRS